MVLFFFECFYDISWWQLASEEGLEVVSMWVIGCRMAHVRIGL